MTLGAGLHVLIGPNGSGKTTLFRVAAGVLLPWAGTVDRHGAGQVGYVAHRPALSARLSVEDNLHYWARMHRLPADGRVPDVLGGLGLGALRGRRASTLSRGQAQRLALARVLLTDPRTILLDEPFAGIDPSGAQQLRELIAVLAGDDRCVVISSHALTDLDDLPADVLALREGRLVAHGSPQRLRGDLTGAGHRVRVRGDSRTSAVLTELGMTWEPVAGRGEADGAVWVSVGSATDVPVLVRHLVERGVDVHEVAPATGDLTQIYLTLAEEP